MQTSEVSELVDQVRDLQHRVEYLERTLGVAGRAVQSEPHELPQPAPTAAATPGLIPAFGRSLLVIAGAFLLRASSESGVIPPIAGVVITILYAVVWLAAASRSRTPDHLLTAISGATAAFILYPMLWEVTVRFQVLTPIATACVIAFFPAAALLVAWRSNLSEIVTITSLCSLASAVALIIATRDVIPFAAAILAIAAATEIAACMDHWLPIRAITAFTADVAILLLLYLILLPGGVPQGYAPISVSQVVLLALTLLAISVAGTVSRTLVRGRDISSFEIAQLASVMLMVLYGAWRLEQKSGASPTPVGLLVMLGGAVCYLVAFAYLDRRTKKDRNFYAYSSLALALTAAGSLFLFAGSMLVVFWSLAAGAAVYSGVRSGRNTVRGHGALYLLLATNAASLAGNSVQRILSSHPPAVTTPEIVAWFCAAVCYALFWVDAQQAGRRWPVYLSPLLAATVLLLSTAGFLSALLHPLPYSQTLNTAVLTVLAFPIAVAGQRHRELAWLLYPWMLFAGYKLLAIDFSQGDKAGFALSLVLFGGALVLLPRLMRRATAQTGRATRGL